MLEIRCAGCREVVMQVRLRKERELPSNNLDGCRYIMIAVKEVVAGRRKVLDAVRQHRSNVTFRESCASKHSRSLENRCDRHQARCVAALPGPILVQPQHSRTVSSRPLMCLCTVHTYFCSQPFQAGFSCRESNRRLCTADWKPTRSSLFMGIFVKANKRLSASCTVLQ